MRYTTLAIAWICGATSASNNASEVVFPVGAKLDVRVNPVDHPSPLSRRMVVEKLVDDHGLVGSGCDTLPSESRRRSCVVALISDALEKEVLEHNLVNGDVGWCVVPSYKDR